METVMGIPMKAVMGMPTEMAMGMLMEAVMGDTGGEGDEPKLIYKGTIITYSFPTKEYHMQIPIYLLTYCMVSTRLHDIPGHEPGNSMPMTDHPTLSKYPRLLHQPTNMNRHNMQESH